MTEKQRIMIKGVKEGLLFLLDDQCEFEQLLEELKYKIEKTHHQLLSGPLIHIQIKLGRRIINDEQKEQLSNIIRTQGNLIIQNIESELAPKEKPKAHSELKIITTIVRSGQVIEYDGDLLLIGDVNPGGFVSCGGDIYILGALRGAAHAGKYGMNEAIIVASHMKPTQLKISDIISKSIDEWEPSDALMEYAFLQEGQMIIEKLSHLNRSSRLPVIMKGV